LKFDCISTIWYNFNNQHLLKEVFHLGIFKSFIRAISSDGQEQNSSDPREKRASYQEARQNYQQQNKECQPDMCDISHCHYYVPYLTQRVCSQCNYCSDDGRQYTCQKDYRSFPKDPSARCRLSGCSRQNYEPIYSKSPLDNMCPLPPKY